MRRFLPLAVLLIGLLGLTACAGVGPVTPTAVPVAPGVGLANPASAFCVEKGGRVNIVSDATGAQTGMCVFPDGRQCEEWAFYRGQCTPALPLTLDMLKNAEYPSDFTASKKAKLTDGRYEGEVQSGAASKIVTTLYPTHAVGDLNGDGADDAAVILTTNSGGSGTFYVLVAVLNQGGTPKAAATASLGDRVKVESLVINAGEIVLDMVTHGPQDPMCCPTQKATRRFKLQGDKLVET